MRRSTPTICDVRLPKQDTSSTIFQPFFSWFATAFFVFSILGVGGSPLGVSGLGSR